MTFVVVTRAITRLILVTTLLFSLRAISAPILQIDADGFLIGAKNVSVYNVLYDVSFQDGTCVALFSGCDSPSDFAFQYYGYAPNPLDPTGFSAIHAANALLNTVLIDSPVGLFDSHPYLTRGCTSASQCYIFTPFDVDSSGTVRTAITANRPGIAGNDFIGGILDRSSSTDFVYSDPARDEATWAVWRVAGGQAANLAPEPSTVMLFGAAMFILAAIRWQRQCR